MDYIKLTFTPKTAGCISEGDIDMLWYYLSSLYSNGQILYNYEVVKRSESFHAFLTLPESDSLNSSYCSTYVKEANRKIKTLYKTKREYLGDNISFETPCSCSNPSWYILYTDYSLIESPIVCGDCGKKVPLYKLPYLPTKDDHYELVSWQAAYQSVDRLWFYGLSDRFTYRQMHKHNSPLSMIAKELCEGLEMVTEKPFYRFLFNYSRGYPSCPVCGDEWSMAEYKPSFISYKCDVCRIAANKTV